MLMPQYGFFFDQSRCDHFHSCTVACKQWNNLSPGIAKWLRLFEWETGTFPNQRLNSLFAPCYHCENPVCIDACPNKAIYKEEKYGAVLVDPEKCKGARECWKACPYGALQFESEEPGSKVSKCTMCIDRLEEGKSPVCVNTCHMRALDFGLLDELKTKYGSLSQLEGMPDPATTQPAIVFKPNDSKKQVVPYDVKRVLELQAKRPYGMRNVFESPHDATEIPSGLLARDSLVMKPKTREEIINYTTHSEG
jgi:anaerobic dimethyl sulfoxide reductase subunit B (iron-sulfur subunit)